MRKELTSKLYLRFPDIFKGRSKPLTESLMAFGLECGDGWFDLIHELCEDLERHETLDDVPLPEAVQIKEKIGGLRFYVGVTTQEMLDIIHEAEIRSEKICEICGLKGERFSDGGWIKTRCENHKKD